MMVGGRLVVVGGGLVVVGGGLVVVEGLVVVGDVPMVGAGFFAGSVVGPPQARESTVSAAPRLPREALRRVMGKGVSKPLATSPYVCVVNHFRYLIGLKCRPMGHLRR